MIRKWNEFVKESIETEGLIPGPNEEGSIRLRLDDEEEEMFSSEPALENLISNQKVSLFDNEVWYFSNDKETINILKEYFPEIEDGSLSRVDDEDFDENPLGWDEELESMRISESINDEKKKLMDRLSKIKSDIKKLDKEYYDIMKDIHKIEDKMDKPESYKDKMKRLVAKSKEKLNKNK